MKETKSYVVYTHINKANNKVYVGLTSQKLEQRWRRGEGYKKNDHFYRAIQKYGWDGFEHKVVSSGLNKKDAINLEIKLIKELQPNDYKKGYNICSGGEGATGLYGEKNPRWGKHCTEETKQKIRGTKKKNGTGKHTEEWKKANSERMKEKYKDEDYVKKMRASGLWDGRKGEKHPMFGRKGKDNPKSKMVKCMETQEIFASATLASESKKVNLSKLCMCCRGERKTCGGYHWEYVEKERE